ncbi:hypothetical protein HGM15179_001356 [Zosterops borbonicus]|uniref:Rna-directed dna polymerase from mobile element jockey-like n=1 Tax=Zosterops borbonicus TaxID=364589 RepID=A0A8K1GUQ6_9PASS|nr:hypothetical protein HGM15179_001356 [Zosterops borbonicus]
MNDLDVGLEGTLSKFDNTKLEGAVDILKTRETLTRGPAGWAIMNSMKFNKDKWRTLHLGQGNPGFMYRLGHERLESKAAERDPGVLIDIKSNSPRMLQNHQLSKQHSLACAQHKQVLLHLPNSIAQEEAPVDQCEKRGGKRPAKRGAILSENTVVFFKARSK